MLSPRTSGAWRGRGGADTGSESLCWDKPAWKPPPPGASCPPWPPACQLPLLPTACEPPRTEKGRCLIFTCISVPCSSGRSERCPFCSPINSRQQDTGYALGTYQQREDYRRHARDQPAFIPDRCYVTHVENPLKFMLQSPGTFRNVLVAEPGGSGGERGHRWETQQRPRPGSHLARTPPAQS